MYPSASPPDSAIYVAATNTSKKASSSSRPSSASKQSSAATDNSKSKSNSPHSAPQTYAHLTPAEQAAADLESTNAVEQAQAGIEVDFSDSATDPGYESDALGSSSSSLSSSISDYKFENGRRYHRFREGAYNFPNDETEQDREDMKHALIVNLCGGRLHFANIGENPQNILDMGTGTGIWAIESESSVLEEARYWTEGRLMRAVGDLYPGANILGVDLSPIQPEWVPPSVKFMVDDVESTWLRPLNHYDYIHGRHLVTAIKNWPQLMGRVFKYVLLSFPALLKALSKAK